MGDDSMQAQPFKRTQYVVDARAQWKLILPLAVVLLGIAFAYALAIYLLPGGPALETMTARETRQLFLIANTIYCAIAVAGFGGVAIVVTHRVIGQNEQSAAGLFGEAFVRKGAGRVGDLLGQLDVDLVFAAAIELSQAAEEPRGTPAGSGRPERVPIDARRGLRSWRFVTRALE